MDAMLAVRIAASPALEACRRRGFGRRIPAVRQYVDLRGARGSAVPGKTGAGAMGPGPRPRLPRGRALALAGARRYSASGPARVPRRPAAPVSEGGVGRPRPRGPVHALRGVRAVAAALPVRGPDVAATVVSRTPARVAGRAGLGPRDQRRARPRPGDRQRTGNTARVAHAPGYGGRSSVWQHG